MSPVADFRPAAHLLRRTQINRRPLSVTFTIPFTGIEDLKVVFCLHRALCLRQACPSRSVLLRTFINPELCRLYSLQEAHPGMAQLQLTWEGLAFRNASEFLKWALLRKYSFPKPQIRRQGGSQMTTLLVAYSLLLIHFFCRGGGGGGRGKH